jgi:hypothetical protein
VSKHFLLLVLLLASASCKGPVAIAHALGTAGWAQIDRPGSKSASRYKEHFTLAPLESGQPPSCDAMGLAEHGPVFVLVHGIRGDGEEMEDAVPIIAKAKPAGLFMFRWMPFEKLGPISDGLALGISRLLVCRPGEEVVVVAHSAGGVVTSIAASKVVVPTGAKEGAVKVMTVASPLAGTMRRPRHEDGRAETHFILDLGTRFEAYQAAAPGVQVVHLRSQYPADSVMKPQEDFSPNDPRVGVPGAPQIDLPAELSHVGALTFVARQLADGTWRKYFAN